MRLSKSAVGWCIEGFKKRFLFPLEVVLLYNERMDVYTSQE